METVSSNLHRHTQTPSQVGLVDYDAYLSQLEPLVDSPTMGLDVLPEGFKLKLVLEKESSIISSSIYRLKLKLKDDVLMSVSKQVFGKYVFTRGFAGGPQMAYMSKYGNQYKLYVKTQSGKLELGYFMLSTSEKEGVSSRAIFPRIQPSSKIRKIVSTTKGDSDIKWQWKSKCEGVVPLKIVRTCKNILGLNYLFVVDQQTLSNPKLVLRELDQNSWEYFIEHPLTLLQGFALAVLLADNMFD